MSSHKSKPEIYGYIHLMSKQILYLFLFYLVFSWILGLLYLWSFLPPPFFFLKIIYPCLCLCLGLEQITIIRPRLRISRHFSQILRTEALIFIFVIP